MRARLARRPVPRAGRSLRRRAAPIVAVALAAAASGGCAAVLQGGDIGPDGRSITDTRLRGMLAAGRADSALAWLNAEPDRLPGDDLLDHLYLGVLTHHAGRYEESSLWLRAAYEHAEDRYTKSVLASALSLIANDRVLPYEPGETERLLIHYYNAKNHLALEDTDGAAVEARRLSLLLDRYDDASPPTRLRAAFRAFASAVFAAAGEWNDADVAARKAAAQGARWAADDARDERQDTARGLVSVPLAELAAGPPPRGPTAASGGTGRLVLVVERGRVAQRVEVSALLTVDDRHRERLHRGGRSRVYASMDLARQLAPEDVGTEFLTALAEAEAEAASEEAEAERPEDEGSADAAATGAPLGADQAGARAAGSSPAVEVDAAADADRDGRDRGDSYDPNPYFMRVAWAAYTRRPAARSYPGASLSVDEEPAGARRLDLDISAGVIDDHRRDVAWAIARAVARAGVKLALTRAIETEAGEKNETVGRILGAVANAGAALTERADLRSWALVPDRLELLRIDLPPGHHRIELVTPSGGRLDLGRVRVAAGRTRLLFADHDPGGM